MVNVGGRGAYTTEFRDLQSGQVRSVYDKYLDINHHVAILYNDEIWIPCDLSGAAVNNENTMNHMLIVNAETGKVRQGPPLRVSRGACGAVVISKIVVDKKNIINIVDDESQRTDININRWTEDVICIIGGSIGRHDTGEITNHTDCYKQRARGWIVLPNLPIQLDHLVAHIYNQPFDSRNTARIIPTELYEDQVLVVVGGRTKNYLDDRQEIYTMSLSSSVWNLTAKMSGRRSAFGSCIFDNRYIVAAGGVSYPDVKGPKLIHSGIEICDMSIGKCHISKAKLHIRRFATTTGCSLREVCFICGGTHRGFDNLKSCEAFTKDILLDGRR